MKAEIGSAAPAAREGATAAPGEAAGRRSGGLPPLDEMLGAAALAALVLITLANVLVRYFSSRSFAWTEEISVFLLVGLTLAGSACAAVRDGHMRVEYFYARGSLARRRTLLLLSAAASVGLFALLAWLTGRAAYDQYELGETTMGIGAPRWWYTVWLPGLALLVAMRAGMAAVRQLRALRDEEQAS